MDEKAIRRYRNRRDGRLKKRGFRFDLEWDENKHPRAKDGTFSSTGGGSGKIEVSGPKASKSS